MTNERYYMTLFRKIFEPALQLDNLGLCSSIEGLQSISELRFCLFGGGEAVSDISSSSESEENVVYFLYFLSIFFWEETKTGLFDLSHFMILSGICGWVSWKLISKEFIVADSSLVRSLLWKEVTWWPSISIFWICIFEIVEEEFAIEEKEEDENEDWGVSWDTTSFLIGLSLLNTAKLCCE